MKRILFIAPDSYPINGAESIVNIKLLSVLSTSGNFKIDLISKNSKVKDYKSNSLDELGVKVNSINIIEVDNRLTLKSIIGHLLCLLRFGVVFKGSHWAVKALTSALELCKNNKYDYVLTKNASAPLVGAYLKKKLGIKWVATWNDPYPHFLYPPIYSKFFKAKKTFMMNKVISVMRKADVHIFPSKQLRDYMVPKLNINVVDTTVIPHVAIPKDFNKKFSEDKLRMIHSGSIAYPRDAEIFLRGLKLFIENNNVTNITFDILGTVDLQTKENVKKLRLEEFVKFLPPVSYNKSLELLKEYDLAVIVEAVLDEGIFLPTKVADFMQERMPILAVSPKEGVLKDLYESLHVNYFSHNESVDSVYDALCNVYGDFINKKMQSSTIPDSYKPLEIIHKYSQM